MTMDQENLDLSETEGATETEAQPKQLLDSQVKSIIESLLFANVHPTSFAAIKGMFHGTNINSDRLHSIIESLRTDYAGGERGIILEEVAGGYQLRTKVENSLWLKKMVKARPFKISGPALEVLSIIAYKQPVVKAEVDQIRGVESGHLVRALMEKNIIKFMGKSELPGKPMLYGTTKEFLELFGLRNIRELPTLSEIDELIPEGIGENKEIEGGDTLETLSEKTGLAPGKSYSESESELVTITDDLAQISTSSEFFEQEKIKERERRDQERAQDIRERKIIGEVISDTDIKWLTRYDQKMDTLSMKAAQPLPANPTNIAQALADIIEENEEEKNEEFAVPTKITFES